MLFNFFDAVDFYESFTPIKKDIKIPKNLKSFAEALSNHHSLDLNIELTDPIINEKTELNNKKALVLFSSGIDSTWNLVKGIDLGFEIYPVYIKGINPSTSSQELKACQDIVDNLGLQLTVYKHPHSLKYLHRSESNLFDTVESLVKLQYSLLLCKDLILKEKIGNVIVTVDENNVIYHNPNSMRDEDNKQIKWFSDTIISMETFLPFLSDYIGAEIKGIYPSIQKHEKIKCLMEKGIFELTNSCVCNPVFKAGHRKKHYAPKYENMCGVCWKCKENLKFLKLVE